MLHSFVIIINFIINYYKFFSDIKYLPDLEELTEIGTPSYALLNPEIVSINLIWGNHQMSAKATNNLSLLTQDFYLLTLST